MLSLVFNPRYVCLKNRFMHMYHVLEVQAGIAFHDPKLPLSHSASSPQKRRNYPEDIYFFVTKNDGAGALELCIYDGFSSHPTYVPDAV